MIRSARPTAAVAVLAVLLLVGGAITVGAQDATPLADSAAPEPSGAFLAHVHAGTCSEYEAAPVAALAEMAFPHSAGEDGDVAAEDKPLPVAVGATDVPLTADAIFAAPHVIHVSSFEDPTGSVACGVIAGGVDAQGNAFVGLREHDESGVSGTAWLYANSESTTVTLFLTFDDAGHAHDGEQAAPAATPVNS